MPHHFQCVTRADHHKRTRFPILNTCLRWGVLATLSVGLISACGKKEGTHASASTSTAGVSTSSLVASNTASASVAVGTLKITNEDIYTVSNSSVQTGPIITGNIVAERRADLRAEVAAVVKEVVKENGEAVRKGDLLVVLDNTSFSDQLSSAQQSANAASLTLEQAQKQVDRLKTLRESGMASMAALEDAENRRNLAKSEAVAAQARVVNARLQLQRTQIRAPFDGVVSERKVSSGDTAQIGKEMLKVIDMKSLRFQGLISTEMIGAVKQGQGVTFKVNGFDEIYTGKVKRIDPSANATTRQVEIMVEFTGDKKPTVAGLYAEGRIEAVSEQAITVPESSIVQEGDNYSVWLIQNGELKKMSVTLGHKDVRTAFYQIKQGLKASHQILLQPNANLKEGLKVQMTSSLSSKTDAQNKGDKPS